MSICARILTRMHEEIEDERGYRFYLNSTTKVKYKEHPSLILIIKKIKTDYSDVKYSSYRSAVKIIQLKNSLFSKCLAQITMNYKNKKKMLEGQKIMPSIL